MTEIQSIIFNKQNYSIDSAKKFLKDHKLFPIKDVHITKNYYRFRLKNPDTSIYNYKIKQISSGVKLIFQYKKD